MDQTTKIQTVNMSIQPFFHFLYSLSYTESVHKAGWSGFQLITGHTHTDPFTQYGQFEETPLDKGRKPEELRRNT